MRTTITMTQRWYTTMILHDQEYGSDNDMNTATIMLVLMLMLVMVMLFLMMMMLMLFIFFADMRVLLLQNVK